MSLSSLLQPRFLQRLAFVACCSALATSAFGGSALGQGTDDASQAATPSLAVTDLAFKIHIRDSGVYRLSFEDLVQATAEGATAEGATVAGATLAQPLRPLPSAQLAMSVGGAAVPLWIEDGGDEQFGPGDHLEWVGERLHGEHDYYHPHSSFNVYRLALDGAAKRMHSLTTTAASAKDLKNQWNVLTVHEHLEEDRQMLRFGKAMVGLDAEVERDAWHWAKLTHLDRRPFRLPLDLSNFNHRSTEPLRLRLFLSGWSKPKQVPEGIPHHQVQVLLNGVALGEGSWQAHRETEIVLEVTDSSLVKHGANLLEVLVPKRQLPDSDDLLIDVVLLNWIELTYPRSVRLRSAHERFEIRGAKAQRLLSFDAAIGDRYTFYSEDGHRIPPEDQQRIDDTKWTRSTWLTPGESGPSSIGGTAFAVRSDAYLSAESITLDVPSHLKSSDWQADYLMIVHPSLRQAIAPLAARHRERGLTVEVIDVVDIYDEFSHGVVDPNAIRDFIAFAYHQGSTPRPQFVLLVGDASWDIKNSTAEDANYADWTYRPGETRRFSKNTSFAYSDQPSDPSQRNLIPAWSYQGTQGHAASDNGFVTVDGDDDLPDLAIGRLPVTQPDEVTAIVDKTLRYLDDAPVGPWRQDVLWITNEKPFYQHRSDRIAAELLPRGFSGTKIYPSPDESDNLEHQQSLRQALDDGQLLVHFYGHGGRYIWRTGPPDLKKNHDLFTLDDLDLLVPSERLPLVLSMSCYSAPFDHPTADSIGEKFLRLEERGAIAVLAASWRNNPNPTFSRNLLRELTKPQAMGEAVRLAKVKTRHHTMIAMYNFLGDPAVPLALPADQITFTVGPQRRIAVDLGGLNEGKALVTWSGESGQLLAQQELSLTASNLQLTLPEDPEIHHLQVYAWDSTSQRDAHGALPLQPLRASQDASPSTVDAPSKE